MTSVLVVVLRFLRPIAVTKVYRYACYFLSFLFDDRSSLVVLGR